MKKKFKKSYLLYNKNKYYNLEKAINIIKEICNNIYNRCKSSIDLSINFNNKNNIFNKIAFKKIIKFPYKNNKIYKYLVLTNNKKDIKIIKNMGIKYVGGEEYINKIKNKWIDFNIIITIPLFMEKIVKLGNILGPKNLIPNNFLGNITNNPIDTIKELEEGKVLIKMDKYKIINCSIAKSDFSINKIKTNIIYLLNNILSTKPINNNKDYIKSIFISSTFSPSVKIKKIW
ncbi:MAG: hypothetical protein ABNO50_00465 [Candidatus Shikimatogenerans sp. Tduv]|uniref:Ribosomal protein n=1 Tax=Candidatus Shikimatogenerans sp. Tduv TaxID=3158567 RepID=A0AAU7QQT3_9FLAO